MWLLLSYYFLSGLVIYRNWKGDRIGDELYLANSTWKVIRFFQRQKQFIQIQKNILHSHCICYYVFKTPCFFLSNLSYFNILIKSKYCKFFLFHCGQEFTISQKQAFQLRERNYHIPKTCVWEAAKEPGPRSQSIFPNSPEVSSAEEDPKSAAFSSRLHFAVSKISVWA